MTSDGIDTSDWDKVQEYAAQIANAVSSSDDNAPNNITEQLLRYLDFLQAKYGKLPSILATRADYIPNLRQRLRLLEDAYEIAKCSGDKQNLMLITSSLAQLFTEELADVSSAEKWLALFADALGDKWDDLEHQELQKLLAKVENLKLKNLKTDK